MSLSNSKRMAHRPMTHGACWRRSVRFTSTKTVCHKIGIVTTVFNGGIRSTALPPRDILPRWKSRAVLPLKWAVSPCRRGRTRKSPPKTRYSPRPWKICAQKPFPKGIPAGAIRTAFTSPKSIRMATLGQIPLWDCQITMNKRSPPSAASRFALPWRRPSV